MTAPVPTSANDLVTGQILDRLRQLERTNNSDFLAYSGPISDSTPDLIKGVVESISKKRPTITVWLETNGGYVESTERIVNILRHHYRRVDFVVTTYAMSAGTILVMAGDSITMDYSATLGPIDPQIARAGSNRFVPALGYLEQYERLVEKSRTNQITTAELAYLLQNFDAAELYQFEQARDLSIALIEEWLPKYKFKNWRVTKGSGTKVTAAMRRSRANEIARRLNDTTAWHSHSRGISMNVLRQSLNLEIEDIADTPVFAEELANFLGLMYDFKRKMGHDYFVIACSEGYHGH
jgi:membrane-bound ClpP family serine protease